MKITIITAAALALLAMVQSSAASLALTSGYDSTATIYGADRYRNFGANAGAGNTYEGTNLGSGSGRVQQIAAWSSGNTSFTFTYDATSGMLSSTVAGQAAVTYALGTLPNSVNYLQLLVQNPNSGALISLNNLTLTPTGGIASTLGNYGNGTVNGSGNFNLTDNSLNAGFTLTGLINWNGINATSQESPKIEFDLGNSTLAAVPEPSTIAAGAALLLPFGMGVFRVLRKNRPV